MSANTGTSRATRDQELPSCWVSPISVVVSNIGPEIRPCGTVFPSDCYLTSACVGSGEPLAPIPPSWCPRGAAWWVREQRSLSQSCLCFLHQWLSLENLSQETIGCEGWRRRAGERRGRSR